MGRRRWERKGVIITIVVGVVFRFIFLGFISYEGWIILVCLERIGCIVNK